MLEQRIGRKQALINAITDEYWLANESDVRQGMAWYDIALAEARTLDGSNGVRGAGVIAALSPLASWGKNIERARIAFERGTAEGLTFALHTNRADRILKGEHPVDVLGGNKVRSFFLCIMGSPTAITVDRHALDVALRRFTTEKEKKVLDLKGGYDYVADAYAQAAVWANVQPRILQAITWTSWRRRKGVDRWADERNGT